MKYKNIDSALHNFGQSFLSVMNYFEDDHVMYDVFNVATSLRGEVFSINFSKASFHPDKAENSRIKKSMYHYRGRLFKHLQNHNLDPESLFEVTLLVKRTRMGIEAFMDATDDRGCMHHVYINLA